MPLQTELIIFLTSISFVLYESLPVKTGIKMCTRLEDRADCNNMSLTEVPQFTNASTLRFLHLQNNHLSKLTVGVFDIYVNLMSLKLDDNEITELEVGLFDVLTRLQLLSLEYNQITQLAVGLFDTLKTVYFLYIKYNKLTNLSMGVFDGMKNMQNLHISHNRITGLMLGIFEYTTKIMNLDVSENEIAIVHEGVFDSLTKLQIMNLNKNKISHLDVGIFDTTTSVKRLTILKNKISSLSVGLFNALAGLELLVLSKNQISELGVGLFDSLINVEILISESWDLVPAPAKVNTEIGMLHGNPMLTLDPNIFNQMPLLAYLTLPVLCNCSENQMFILPFIQKASFKIIVYNINIKFESEWADLTRNCTSPLLDVEYCELFKTIAETSDMYNFTVSTQRSTDVSSFTEAAVRTSEKDHSTAATNKTSEEEGLTVEGIFYTGFATAVGVISSAMIIYQVFSRIQTTFDIVQSERDVRIAEFSQYIDAAGTVKRKTTKEACSHTRFY